LLAPSAAPAADTWTGLGSDEGIAIFYDPSSVRRTGDVVQVRARLVPAVPDAQGYGAFVVLQDVDCRAQTSNIIAAQGFTTTGELYRSVEVPADEGQAEPRSPAASRSCSIASFAPPDAPFPRPSRRDRRRSRRSRARMAGTTASARSRARPQPPAGSASRRSSIFSVAAEVSPVTFDACATRGAALNSGGVVPAALPRD
jgi:hypothetical protein